MRGICAAVLVFEALVVLFATLVARDLTDIDHGTLWAVGGSASLLCLVLAALLRHRWAFVAGSVLQVGLVAAGLVVPVMFFLGLVFGGLWFAAIHLGRRVERLQAAGGGPEPR